MKRQSIPVLEVVVLTPFLSQAVERTCVVGAGVRLDSSLLDEVIDVVQYAIVEILPFVAIVIIFLLIVLLAWQLLSWLFR